MAGVIIFHSVLGIRTSEEALAARLRQTGRDVAMPDLYDGIFTDNLDEGFKIKDHIGWDRICQRARAAVDGAPGDAVLLGISMGAGVVAEVWPFRVRTKGVILLHGLAPLPADVATGLPLQLHISAHDPFFPPAAVDQWQLDAERVGISPQIIRHTVPGHYFSDSRSKDFSAPHAERIFSELNPFLQRLD